MVGDVKNAPEVNAVEIVELSKRPKKSNGRALSLSSTTRGSDWEERIRDADNKSSNSVVRWHRICDGKIAYDRPRVEIPSPTH